MGNQGEELLMAAYKSSNFTAGCLEICLFYVRITFCAVDVVPDHLILRHLRREIGVLLEINGCRILSSDTIFITLSRDRVDKGSSEVTYVRTDNVRVFGTVEFEVHEKKEELILCGSLERVEGTWDNGNGTGWSMDCYNAASFGSGGSVFFQSKIGVSSPSIEVYVASCCSGVPLILTKTIQVSPRRKLFRHSMLDSIPEDEGVGKEH
ncbi:hypothetical protein AABB24_001501 [Solanum stoloniferum]|uniref:Uncharacterized protein n=2 Tax=Solanum TaxID=4107 RepID=A0AAF0Q0Z3_SOLVR|nr:hypothetical protein MTR67_004879 [Solanum verrucosum]